jgi:DNA-binding HxlR family transcriptional regulator
METKSRRVKLPTITDTQNCSFYGYDAMSLMAETAKLRRLITKRGTLEILIPLCCTTDPVRYMKFRQTLRGFSSKTLAIRLKELQKGGILERQAYNTIKILFIVRVLNLHYCLKRKGSTAFHSTAFH